MEYNSRKHSHNRLVVRTVVACLAGFVGLVVGRIFPLEVKLKYVLGSLGLDQLAYELELLSESENRQLEDGQLSWSPFFESRYHCQRTYK